MYLRRALVRKLAGQFRPQQQCLFRNAVVLLRLFDYLVQPSRAASTNKLAA